MEMERVFEATDNDCGASSSRLLLNEQEELASQASSEKTLESQESQNAEKNPKETESNKILQEDNLQMMIQNYKQIGGELKYNLKLLEVQWQSLKKVVMEKTHECEILTNQKEHQMKNLVDLQIRLENLDMERVKLLSDCKKGKAEMIEAFTHDMQSSLENNVFLRATYDKFHEIVESEKREFNKFLTQMEKLTELHNKAGEEYAKGIIEIKSSLQNLFGSLAEDEKHLSEEIKNTFEKCKPLQEKVIRLKEKIMIAKGELNKINECLKQLLSDFGERKVSSEEKENAFLEKESQFREKCLEMENEVRTIKNNHERLISERKEKLEILSNEKKLQESLRASCEDFAQQLSKLGTDYLSKEQELSALEEEFQLTLVQLNDAKIEIANLQELASKLSSDIATLNDLKVKESEIKDAIPLLKEEIIAHEETYKDLRASENSHKGIEEELIVSADEWQKKHTEVEKELEEVFELSRDHCETAGMELAEKYKEFDGIKSEVDQDELEETNLSDKLIEIEKDIYESEATKKIMSDTEEKLYEEVNQLNLMSEKIDQLNIEYEESVLELANIDSELSIVNKDLHELPEEKELLDDLNQIGIEINELTSQHIEETAATERTFHSQHENWKSKFLEEMEELDQRTGIREDKMKKMLEEAPRLNQELMDLEKELKESLPSLAKEVQNTYKIFEDMANFYNKYNEMSKKKVLKEEAMRKLRFISERFFQPMKCMMTFDGIPEINLDNPTSDAYITLLNVFRDKYLNALDGLGSNPPIDVSTKVFEIGSSILGKKWVEPTYPAETPNETEISSTSEVIR